MENKKSNQPDKITVDVPLFIRLLEYAREDAKTDMDLHDVAENAIAMSTGGKTLCMKDYSKLVKKSKTVKESQNMGSRLIVEARRMQKLAGLLTESEDANSRESYQIHPSKSGRYYWDSKYDVVFNKVPKHPEEPLHQLEGGWNDEEFYTKDHFWKYDTPYDEKNDAEAGTIDANGKWSFTWMGDLTVEGFVEHDDFEFIEKE